MMVVFIILFIVIVGVISYLVSALYIYLFIVSLAWITGGRKVGGKKRGKLKWRKLTVADMETESEIENGRGGGGDDPDGSWGRRDGK